MSGWEITEWTVAIAAFLTAGGVIHQKVVKPVRAWWRSFKAWMLRVETSTAWTDEQMRPNGGSTLVDKVDKVIAEVSEMKSHVSLLLEHDAERDTAGKRYGKPTEEQ